MKKFIYILSILTLICSCNKKSDSKNPLHYEGRIAFKLSENTAHAGILKIVTFKDHNSDYVSLFDGSYKTIYVYSLKDHNMVKKITIKDSLYDSYDGSIFIQNFDTIFLLEMFNKNLLLIDSSGKTLQKIKIRDQRLIDEENKKGNQYIPFPCDASNSNGFFFVDDKIYISSTGNETVDYSINCKDIFIVDLSNKQSMLSFQKPETYYKGYWGNNFLHSIQLVFNPNNKTFFISYGADHYVYETDFKNIIKRYLIKSKFLDNSKPFGDKKPSAYHKDPSIEKYNYTNGSYSNIYYDEKNRLFLRFVNIPYSNEKYEEEMKTGFNNLVRSIIISDKNMKPITEFSLHEKLTIPVFINDGLLYFNDSDSYRKNQDSIYFKVYSIKL